MSDMPPPQGLCTGSLQLPPRPPCWNSLLNDLHMAPSLLPSTHVCAQMSLFLSYHPLCPFPCFIFPHCTHHILCVLCVCVCEILQCLLLPPECQLHQGRACPLSCSPLYPNAYNTAWQALKEHLVNEHIGLYPLCYTPAQTPHTLPR